MLHLLDVAVEHLEEVHVPVDGCGVGLAGDDASGGRGGQGLLVFGAVVLPVDLPLVDADREVVGHLAHLGAEQPQVGGVVALPEGGQQLLLYPVG